MKERKNVGERESDRNREGEEGRRRRGRREERRVEETPLATEIISIAGEGERKRRGREK